MNTVIIALGSNIAPEQNMAAAIDILKNEFTLNTQSKIIKTAPVGYTDQDDFLNGAVSIQTDRSLDELKESLHRIEDQLGRKRGPNKFGPRTIDLDIVVWNNTIINDDYFTRDFIRNAVLEIQPDLA